MSTPPFRAPCPGGFGLKRQCWAVDGGTHCRNHDPSLAQQRRDNGCVRKSGAPVPILRTALGTDGRYRKPEHEPAHVKQPPPLLTRAQQRAQEAAERAQSLLTGPEPIKSELRSLALRVLRAIAVYGGETPQVTAAKALLDYTSPTETDDQADSFPSLDEELSDDPPAPVQQ